MPIKAPPTLKDRYCTKKNVAVTLPKKNHAMRQAASDPITLQTIDNTLSITQPQKINPILKRFGFSPINPEAQASTSLQEAKSEQTKDDSLLLIDFKCCNMTDPLQVEIKFLVENTQAKRSAYRYCHIPNTMYSRQLLSEIVAFALKKPFTDFKQNLLHIIQEKTNIKTMLQDQIHIVYTIMRGTPKGRTLTSESRSVRVIFSQQVNPIYQHEHEHSMWYVYIIDQQGHKKIIISKAQHHSFLEGILGNAIDPIELQDLNNINTAQDIASHYSSVIPAYTPPPSHHILHFSNNTYHCAHSRLIDFVNRVQKDLAYQENDEELLSWILGRPVFLMSQDTVRYFPSMGAFIYPPRRDFLFEITPSQTILSPSQQHSLVYHLQYSPNPQQWMLFRYDKHLSVSSDPTKGNHAVSINLENISPLSPTQHLNLHEWLIPMDLETAKTHEATLLNIIQQYDSACHPYPNICALHITTCYPSFTHLSHNVSQAFPLYILLLLEQCNDWQLFRQTHHQKQPEPIDASALPNQLTRYLGRLRGTSTHQVVNNHKSIFHLQQMITLYELGQFRYPLLLSYEEKKNTVYFDGHYLPKANDPDSDHYIHLMAALYEKTNAIHQFKIYSPDNWQYLHRDDAQLIVHMMRQSNVTTMARIHNHTEPHEIEYLITQQHPTQEALKALTQRVTFQRVFAAQDYPNVFLCTPPNNKGKPSHSFNQGIYFYIETGILYALLVHMDHADPVQETVEFEPINNMPIELQQMIRNWDTAHKINEPQRLRYDIDMAPSLLDAIRKISPYSLSQWILHKDKQQHKVATHAIAHHELEYLFLHQQHYIDTPIRHEEHSALWHRLRYITAMIIPENNTYQLTRAQKSHFLAIHPRTLLTFLIVILALLEAYGRSLFSIYLIEENTYLPLHFSKLAGYLLAMPLCIPRFLHGYKSMQNILNLSRLLGYQKVIHPKNVSKLGIGIFGVYTLLTAILDSIMFYRSIKPLLSEHPCPMILMAIANGIQFFSVEGSTLAHEFNHTFWVHERIFWIQSALGKKTPYKILSGFSILMVNMLIFIGVLPFCLLIADDLQKTLKQWIDISENSIHKQYEKQVIDSLYIGLMCIFYTYTSCLYGTKTKHVLYARLSTILTTPLRSCIAPTCNKSSVAYFMLDRMVYLFTMAATILPAMNLAYWGSTRMLPPEHPLYHITIYIGSPAFGILSYCLLGLSTIQLYRAYRQPLCTTSIPSTENTHFWWEIPFTIQHIFTALSLSMLLAFPNILPDLIKEQPAFNNFLVLPLSSLFFGFAYTACLHYATDAKPYSLTRLLLRQIRLIEHQKYQYRFLPLAYAPTLGKAVPSSRGSTYTLNNIRQIIFPQTTQDALSSYQYHVPIHAEATFYNELLKTLSQQHRDLLVHDSERKAWHICHCKAQPKIPRIIAIIAICDHASHKILNQLLLNAEGGLLDSINHTTQNQVNRIVSTYQKAHRLQEVTLYFSPDSSTLLGQFYPARYGSPLALQSFQPHPDRMQQIKAQFFRYQATHPKDYYNPRACFEGLNQNDREHLHTIVGSAIFSNAPELFKILAGATATPIIILGSCLLLRAIIGAYAPQDAQQVPAEILGSLLGGFLSTLLLLYMLPNKAIDNASAREFTHALIDAPQAEIQTSHYGATAHNHEMTMFRTSTPSAGVRNTSLQQSSDMTHQHHHYARL